jgi:hypothetical protein
MLRGSCGESRNCPPPRRNCPPRRRARAYYICKDILANSKMAKNTVMVFCFLLIPNTTGNGKKINSTAKVRYTNLKKNKYL